MNRLFAALSLPLITAAALLPVVSQAQEAGPKPRAAKPAERAAAVHAIQAQLKAFAHDDYKTAITFQSAGLRRSFPSPAAFRAMMVRTYPEFAHYKSVTFGAAQADAKGDHLAVPASVTGRDGVTVRAVYLLVREGKAYRVEGVSGGAETPPGADPSASDA